MFANAFYPLRQLVGFFVGGIFGISSDRLFAFDEGEVPNISVQFSEGISVSS